MLERVQLTTCLPIHSRRTLRFLLLSCLIGFCHSNAAAGIMDAADERIERHRKRDIKIQFQLPDGAPLNNGTLVKMDLIRHEFLFGANFFAAGELARGDETKYRQLFSDVFNYATLPFYWESYEPQQGRTLQQRWRTAAVWCRKRGIRTKGHPLIWNLEPNWLRGIPIERRESLLWARVSGIVQQYAGVIDTWDVINETTEGVKYAKQRNAHALLNAYQSYGKTPVTVHGFRLARNANQDSTLLINDFDTSDAYVATVRSALNAGADIDAIGIQSHMHQGYWGAEKLWEVCERFAKIGKPIHFTEVTVLSGPLMGKRDTDWTSQRQNWNSTPEGERQQSEQVREMYHLLFSHPQVEAITWWDLSDRKAWLGAPGGLLREDLEPKHAYYVIRDLVRKGWSTNIRQASVRNAVDMRGFYGDYRATAVVNNREYQVKFRLTRKSPEVIQVQLR